MMCRIRKFCNGSFWQFLHYLNSHCYVSVNSTVSAISAVWAEANVMVLYCPLLTPSCIPLVQDPISFPWGCPFWTQQRHSRPDLVETARQCPATGHCPGLALDLVPKLAFVLAKIWNPLWKYKGPTCVHNWTREDVTGRRWICNTVPQNLRK